MKDFIDWVFNDAPEWVVLFMVSIFILLGFAWFFVGLVFLVNEGNVYFLVLPPLLVLFVVYKMYKEDQNKEND